MTKQLVLSLTLALLASVETYGSASMRPKFGAPSSSETAPSSSRRAPSPAPVSAPSASMPAPSAPMSAVDLKGFAASNPADVAAGLAAGLNAKYRGGNANSAAGQAAYNFVVGA